VSQLSNKFVSDAREVVKTGDIVKVKVLEVDLARQRISLTMKLDAKPTPGAPTGRGAPGPRQAPVTNGKSAPVGNAFAAAFERAKSKA
jgi:uncharacterized protein